MISRYAKAIAAALGAAATALQPVYGGAQWYVAIPAAATFLSVLAVSNSPKV